MFHTLSRRIGRGELCVESWDLGEEDMNRDRFCVRCVVAWCDSDEMCGCGAARGGVSDSMMWNISWYSSLSRCDSVFSLEHAILKLDRLINARVQLSICV